ncbi:MAG: heavy metal-associated domain-containing protein [Patescibacteria group bacterium]
MLINFKIDNITCDACVKISKSALNRLPGIKRIEIDKNGLTTLESEQDISLDEIKEVLEKADKKISLI